MAEIQPAVPRFLFLLIKSGKLVWMTFNWQFFLTINAEHCIYRSHVELTVSWCNLFSIFSATQVFFDIIIIWNMQVLDGLQKKKLQHHKEYLWINCFVCFFFVFFFFYKWTTNISLKFFRRKLILTLVQTMCYNVWSFTLYSTFFFDQQFGQLKLLSIRGGEIAKGENKLSHWSESLLLYWPGL